MATHTTTGTNGYEIRTHSYTYDDNGNILSVSGGTNTTTYTYDAANQLIREDNQEEGVSRTWVYDNAGNILERKEYAYTTGELGTPTDTAGYTYGDEDWGDLLTAYDGNTITYDGIGNPLSDGTWTYTWKHGRQLASMTNGEETWTYTYDANGMRSSRSNGTVTYEYVYNGDQLVQMNVGGNVLNFSYDANGVPQAFTHNITLYYYVTNQQGDVIGIQDQWGATVATYSYNAWGEMIIDYNASHEALVYLNPLAYRGYVCDWDTGLYYLQSRYYNPEMGRFINADGMIAGATGELMGYNQFAYCFNNPINLDDSSGNWPKWAKKLVAAVAIVAVVTVVAVATAGTGTLVAAVAAGAAKGAAVGLFSGAATGLVSGAISHRVTTGSWDGADEAALNGMADGALTGAITGAITGGGKVALQKAGVLPTKVNINNVVNNPADEFVTVGPADGVIDKYCRTIPQSGYGKIYVTELENGFYQIANGHHRVAALRKLGYEMVNVYLTK